MPWPETSSRKNQRDEWLQALGLRQLYIGPESGDDQTLKSIAKGSTAQNTRRRQRAKAAGMKMSVIFCWVRGVSHAHRNTPRPPRARKRHGPRLLSALTLTVIKDTDGASPRTGRFVMPDKACCSKLYTFIEHANPLVPSSEPTMPRLPWCGYPAAGQGTDARSDYGGLGGQGGLVLDGGGGFSQDSANSATKSGCEWMFSESLNREPCAE